ncbi:hypothetical protein OFM21_33465, partial [Escherichia coli]|nr:hypothetical protein [Escherichia coli]
DFSAIRQRRALSRLKLSVIAVFIGIAVTVAAFSGFRGGSGSVKADSGDDFATTMAKMKAAKAAIMKRQADLLNERYDLS